MMMMDEALLSFLKTAGLESKCAQLQEHGVDGEIVSSLTEDDLRELGFNLGERRRFFAALRFGEDKIAVTSIPPERRQLTVAFIDLVGSTGLASHLDPEEFRQLISIYLKAATSAMESHGGHVAYVQGDGIMVYFGYPISREDDAEWAIRAGLSVVTTIRSLNVGVEGGIQARVGIATGTVVTGGVAGEFAPTSDFAVGETLNFASRLQGLAAPSEVNISNETRALVGGRFKCEACGSIKLKGFVDPKPIYRVLSEADLTSRFDAHVDRGLHPMVGRDHEQGRLLDLLDHLGESRGRLALVTAPPGFGKSRLVRSIREIHGANFLEWQCVAHLASRALHPVSNELKRAAGIDRTDRRKECHEQLIRFVEKVPGLETADFNRLADLLELSQNEELSEDPVTRLFKIQEVLLRRIAALATADDPLILTLEDAHWADAGTLDFLDLALEAVQDLPVLVIVTYRPHFTPSLRLAAADEIFELRSLDPMAARELIAHVAGETDLPSDIFRWIVDKTDGVPLFIEELTKTIIHTSADLSPGAVLDVFKAMEIPTTLRDSLMSRLDRMGPAKEVAQLASVIGREFTAAMLQAIARSELDVNSAITHLLEAQLLLVQDAGVDGFQFKHALVQDSAYESILRVARQEIHLKIARAMLEEHPAFGVQEPDTIARHCDLGGLAEKAVEKWREAGQQALDRAANLAAFKHFSAALRRLEDLSEGEERDRIELATQMAIMPASMATFGWGSEEVEHACMRAQALARQLSDGATLFGSTWGLWTNYFLRGAMDPALKTGLMLKEMADAHGTPRIFTVAANHAVSYCHYSRGELDAGVKLAEEGMALFDVDMEREIIAMFQLSSGLSLFAIHAALCWQKGRLDDAYASRKRGIEIGEELDHPPSLMHALMVPNFFLLFQHDWPLLEKTVARAEKISEESNLFFWQPMCDFYSGVLDAAKGDVTAGISAADVAIRKLRSTGTRLMLPQFQYAIAELQIDAGRADEALQRLNEAGSEAVNRKENLMIGEWGRLCARALRDLGDIQAADRALRAALDEATARGAVPLLERIMADRTVAEI